MDRLGLVGLPNSGKSALFNALTGGDARRSVPSVLDDRDRGRRARMFPILRVDALAKMSQSRKIVYAGFEVVDIAAIGKGGEKGDGLGSRFPRGGARGRRPLLRAAQLRGRERARRDRSRWLRWASSSSSSSWRTPASLEQQLTKKRKPRGPGRPCARGRSRSRTRMRSKFSNRARRCTGRGCTCDRRR